MSISLLALFFISMLAFSISAICGGGAGLMLIPVLNAVLPVSLVPAALSIGTATSSASRLIVFRKNVCWHIVKYFVPAAIPAVWLGARLLKYVNPVYLEMVMAVFLISNLSFLLKKNKAITVKHPPHNAVLIIIGFLAGFLSGLTGAVGLLFNRFYLRYGLSKEEIVATRAANEILIHIIKIVLYSWFGLISAKVFGVGAIIGLSAIMSTWIMKWLLPKISEVIFRKVGYLAMVLSGCGLLIQSGGDLMTANHATIAAHLQEKGLETKIKWQNANYALEFSYDDGFEIEKVIPISQLTESQQQWVKSIHPTADRIVMEVVLARKSESYEAYYYNQNKLIDKIDFQ